MGTRAEGRSFHPASDSQVFWLPSQRSRPLKHAHFVPLQLINLLVRGRRLDRGGPPYRTVRRGQTVPIRDRPELQGVTSQRLQPWGRELGWQLHCWPPDVAAAAPVTVSFPFPVPTRLGSPSHQFFAHHQFFLCLQDT